MDRKRLEKAMADGNSPERAFYDELCYQNRQMNAPVPEDELFQDLGWDDWCEFDDIAKDLEEGEWVETLTDGRTKIRRFLPRKSIKRAQS